MKEKQQKCIFIYLLIFLKNSLYFLLSYWSNFEKVQLIRQKFIQETLLKLGNKPKIQKT